MGKKVVKGDKMNPLLIIGGLVYVAIGIWTFDEIGVSIRFKKRLDLLFWLILSIYMWPGIWIAFLLFIFLPFIPEVPERYREREKE